MILVQKYRLPQTQLLPQNGKLRRIVLHHTAGASAKSTFDYWASTPERVGTAYMIERDGTIYETFDPAKYWCYHIGSGSNNRDNAESVGIELCSAGGLKKRDGKYYAFGVYSPKTEVNAADVFDNGTLYRGFQYFARYTDAQIASALELIEKLLETYPTIERKTPKNHTAYYNDWKNFGGVVSHTHLRADKSDVHPGFPWERLIQNSNLQVF
jgi:N-acetyl-anhydromuramyl-L-alanine amidase AmpD